MTATETKMGTLKEREISNERSMTTTSSQVVVICAQHNRHGVGSNVDVYQNQGKQNIISMELFNAEFCKPLPDSTFDWGLQKVVNHCVRKGFTEVFVNNGYFKHTYNITDAKPFLIDNLCKRGLDVILYYVE